MWGTQAGEVWTEETDKEDGGKTNLVSRTCVELRIGIRGGEAVMESDLRNGI